jgi:uncharacterized membrane protein YgaE (UPF0421/DUF939 family)
MADSSSSHLVRGLTAVQRVWARHPRWSIALKGSIAAALAWVVGVIAPEPFSEYPYYAPLGAVIATMSTVARSVRESVQAVGALLLGAVIAWTADLVIEPGALGIALVVGVALLCAGWRGFGEMGSWVVNSALFVLILGNADALEYAGVYGGLITVGAAIGVGVNLLYPPLPLTPSEFALDHLRDVLVEQLETVADGLENETTLDVEAWEAQRRNLGPTIVRVRDAVAAVREETRANLRVMRHRGQARSQLRRAEALESVSDVVDVVVRLLVEWEGRSQDEVALGSRLRPAFAQALRRFGAALRTAGPDGADADAAAALTEALDEASEELREARRGTDHDYLVAGALLVTLRRGASTLTGP